MVILFLNSSGPKPTRRKVSTLEVKDCLQVSGQVTVNNSPRILKRKSYMRATLLRIDERFMQLIYLMCILGLTSTIIVSSPKSLRIFKLSIVNPSFVFHSKLLRNLSPFSNTRTLQGVQLNLHQAIACPLLDRRLRYLVYL
jgi:hypothetical protein